MTTQVFRAINESLGKHSRKQNSQNKQRGQKYTDKKEPKPAWYNSAPTNPSQMHDHDGCTWHWCPKCSIDGKGKWVCTHTASEHIDAFPHKQKPDNEGQLKQEAKRASPPPTLPKGITIAALTQFLHQHHADEDSKIGDKTGQDALNQENLDPDDY